MWAMPGGFQEFGEHPSNTVIREVAEETGIDIKLAGMVGIYIQKIKADEYRQVTVFLASALTDALLAGDDASDCRWFSLKSLPSKIVPFHKQIIVDYKNGVSPLKPHILE
jgi:8-oxo-dGTP diphosphatase